MASTIDGLLPQTTTTTSQINPYLYGSLIDVLNASKAEVNKPYTPYTGNRVAQFSPDEIAAQEAVRTAQGATSPLFQQATGAINRGIGGLDSILSGQPFTAQQIQSYMDPYTGQVINTTVDEMLRKQSQDLNTLRSKSGMSGAYGGSRQAILEAELQGATQRNIGSTTADLLSKGYTQALGQLNTDRAARMDAAKGLVSSGSTMGDTASAQQVANYKDINALSASGSDQRTQAQNALDLAYQDFLAQRDYNKNNLTYMNSMLSGVDLSNLSTGSTQTTAPQRSSPSSLQQILGGITTGAGIIKEIFNFAEGGLVNSKNKYAEGGKVERYKAPTKQELEAMKARKAEEERIANMSTLAMLLENMGVPMRGESGNPTLNLGSDFRRTPNNAIFAEQTAKPYDDGFALPILTEYPERQAIEYPQMDYTTAKPNKSFIDYIMSGDASIVGNTPADTLAPSALEALKGMMPIPREQLNLSKQSGAEATQQQIEATPTPEAKSKTKPKTSAVAKAIEAPTPRQEQPIALDGTGTISPEMVQTLNSMLAQNQQQEAPSRVEQMQQGAFNGLNPLLTMGLEILASEPDPYNPMGQIAKAASSGLEKYEAMRKQRVAEAETLDTQKTNKEKVGREMEQEQYNRTRQAALDKETSVMNEFQRRQIEANIKRLEAVSKAASGMSSTSRMDAKIMTELRQLLSKMDPSEPDYAIYKNQLDNLRAKYGVMDTYESELANQAGLNALGTLDTP